MIDREPPKAAESAAQSGRTMVLRDLGATTALAALPAALERRMVGLRADFWEFLVELIQVSVDHRSLCNRYTRGECPCEMRQR